MTLSALKKILPAAVEAQGLAGAYQHADNQIDAAIRQAEVAK